MPQSDPCTGKPDGQGARHFTAKVANDRVGEEGAGQDVFSLFFGK